MSNFSSLTKQYEEAKNKLDGWAEHGRKMVEPQGTKKDSVLRLGDNKLIKQKKLVRKFLIRGQRLLILRSIFLPCNHKSKKQKTSTRLLI